jgi:O-antigen/teichoic acid export membrane protein
VRALLTPSRLRRLAGVATTQAGVQGLSFLAGVVLVRALAPDQYGYYTLAVALVGVANVLTELGVANAVLALGGRLAGRRDALRALVDDALALQAVLAIALPCLVGPAFVLLLRHQHASLAQAVALVAIGAASAFFNVRIAIAQSVARLSGHVAVQQKADLAMNLARLALLALAGLVLLDATVASALGLVAAAGAFAFWQRWLRRELGVGTGLRGQHAPALRDSVRRQAPNCIWYVLNGQLAVWLVGLFGSAERVADVGALGRLGTAFAVITTVVSTLVMPYFARTDAPAQLESGFVALNAFFAALTVALTAAALALPGPILWVLGPHYAGLASELVWMVLGTAFTAWSGSLYSVACARGWVLPAALGIGCGLLAILAGLRLFDLATVAGNLQLTTLTAFVALVVNTGWFGASLLRHRRAAVPGLVEAAR